MRIPLFRFKDLIDVNVYCVTTVFKYCDLSTPNAPDLLTAGFSDALFMLFKIKETNIRHKITFALSSSTLFDYE